MKTAGGLLNRIGGVVNNADKGVFDRARGASAKYREGALASQRERRLKRGSSVLNADPSSRLGKFVKGGANSRRRGAVAAIASGGAITKKNMEERLKNKKGSAEYAEAQYFANRAANDRTFAEAIAGGDSDQATSIQASAVSTLDKLDAEDKKNGQILLQSLGLNRQERMDVAQGGELTRNGQVLLSGSSMAIRAAAMDEVAASGYMDGMNKLWDIAATSSNDELRRYTAQAMASAPNRPAWIGQGAMAAMKSSARNDNGEYEQKVSSSQELMKTAIENGSYSAQSLATGDREELETLNKFIADNKNLASGDPMKLNAGKVKDLAYNAQEALSDPRLKVQIKKNRDEVTTIAGLAPTQAAQAGQSGASSQPTGQQTGPQNTSPTNSSTTNTTNASTTNYTTNNQTTQTGPAGTSNWQQQPSGLYTPPSYTPSASSGANAATVAAAAAAGAAAGGVAGSAGSSNQAPITVQSVSEPSAPTVIPAGGAPIRTAENTTTNTTTNVNNTTNSTNSYETYIKQAGGVQNMSTAEITKMLGDTAGKSGLSNTHDQLRQEYGRRRGSDVAGEPWVPPSQRPNGPTPPPSA